MIALTIVYALLTSALVAAVAWFLERAARTRRLQTRALWAAAMVAMLAFAFGALTDRSRQLDAARPAASAIHDTQLDASTPPSWALGLPVGVTAVVTPLGATAEQWIDAQRVRLSTLDNLLIALWLLSSALLAVAVLHTARRDRLLRKGLVEQHVAGMAVLLSDNAGPAVLGPRAPAILLPRWALDFDDELLTLVLGHEREHVQARDPMLLMLGIMAVVIMPWNVPLWWCWQRLRLAVEADCDHRVLRTHPDVLRYAQLLLLVGQRSINGWPKHGLVSAVAPLTPHASQLAHRIEIMTARPSARRALRAAFLMIGAALTAIVAGALPRPTALSPAAVAPVVAPAPAHAFVVAEGAGETSKAATTRHTGEGRRDFAPGNRSTSLASPEKMVERAQVRTLVHITSVGLDKVPANADGLIDAILVSAPGPASVGIGTEPPKRLRGVLRLKTLPAMTLDVTDSDVHIELLGPGEISLGGTLSGGRALRLSASGRHIVFMKGGFGVQTR